MHQHGRKFANACSNDRGAQRLSSTDLKSTDACLGGNWDTEGRFRLQEVVLALADSARRAESIGVETSQELFRAQVELGLHELTAALSSLR